MPGAAVVDSFYDKSNWCVVLQRDVAKHAGGAGTASTAGAAARIP